MIRTLVSFIFLIQDMFHPVFSQAQDFREIAAFGNNPGNLKMFVHAPAGNFKGMRPLVMVIHGCTETASGIARIAGWNELSDKYGFYVVYPQQKLVNNTYKCFNWFYKHDILKNSGENASMRSMIDFCEHNFPVDTAQVFVYGVSAGGAMATVMMADYPEVFKAGAVIAGAAFIPEGNVFSKGKSMVKPGDYSAAELETFVRKQNQGYGGAYPKMIVMHGTDDPLVNIANAHQITKQWAAIYQHGDKPDTVITTFEQHPLVSRSSWRNTRGEEFLCFYEMKDLKHEIAIDLNPGNKSGGAAGAYSKDIGFFSTYYILMDFGILPPDVSD